MVTGDSMIWLHLQHGITQTSELVNVTDFFNTHIVPDLQSADGKSYILLFHIIISWHTALWRWMQYSLFPFYVNVQI